MHRVPLLPPAGGVGWGGRSWEQHRPCRLSRWQIAASQGTTGGSGGSAGHWWPMQRAMAAADWPTLAPAPSVHRPHSSLHLALQHPNSQYAGPQQRPGPRRAPRGRRESWTGLGRPALRLRGAPAAPGSRLSPGTARVLGPAAHILLAARSLPQAKAPRAMRAQRMIVRAAAVSPGSAAGSGSRSGPPMAC